MTFSKSWETGEVLLTGYAQERYVQVSAKDAVTGKHFTVYLKNISENKNGIVGTEVDKYGSFVKDNSFAGRKHIILKSAILKQQEVRINKKYGKLEVPSHVSGETIIPEKVETVPQSMGEITEKPHFNIITKPINVHKNDYSNLFAKINNLPLSVRTLNCLINRFRLTYIGELAQKTEYELMKIRNFGRRCLYEVKEILSEHGLQLGIIIPDFDTLRYKYEQTQSVDDIEDNSKGDNIDRKSYLNLFRKVSELCLSCRALNCLDNAKIVYIGDLVTKTAHELLLIKNMGRKSVREINSKLSDTGLSLGMKLLGWSQKKIEEEIKLLSNELEMHRKNSAELFLSDVKHADFLEEELIYFIKMLAKGKNIQIITIYFGFDGNGKKTLEATSKGFNCTRERVRQITTQFLKKIDQSGIVKNAYLPILKNIEKYIEKRLPAETDLIEIELVEKGFTKTTFKLEGILEAIKLLEGKQPFYIIKIGRKRLVISSRELKVTKKSTKLILQLSKKLISSYGITNVAEIIDQVFQETGQNITDKYVILILSALKDFSWLDESKGWFWIKSTRRNRILNIIQKILSVCESINIHELRGGIGRFHRMGCFIPTTSVLLELCKQIPRCRIVGNTITANPPIKVEDVLGNHELIMYQILKERGPLMASGDFETACFDSDISRNSFYQYLSYSPILARYTIGVYGLRGANIPPGLAESIAPIKKRESSVSDYGWTKEGNIWIIRKLSPSAIHSAAVGISTALSQYLQESFMLKSVDGTNFGNLQIKHNYASGIYSFLKRSGCEAGDYLALTFYLAKKEVVAYIGGEEIRDDFIAKM